MKSPFSTFLIHSMQGLPKLPFSFEVEIIESIVAEVRQIL